MKADIDRAQWRTILEALGVDAPSDELRTDIAHLYTTAKQLAHHRNRREPAESRRAYQAKVAKAAGELCKLLEDAPPYTMAELWNEGLRHALPHPAPIVQGINELIESVRAIEAFADAVSKTPRYRSELQKRTFADVAVGLYRKHSPQGSRENAQAFAEGIWQAASRGDEASLERQIRKVW